MRWIKAAVISLVIPVSASAAEFEPVRDKGEFISLVSGKELRIGLYNLSLRLSPEGQISGKALGWQISGDWQWKDGYFCREMDWEGKLIEYNCQLVEKRGAQELRFTSNKGKGDSASFRLR